MSSASGDTTAAGGATPYATAPEWHDVTPIYLSDAENAAVRIAYPDDFKEVYAYFRAILEKGELSERAFQLTADAIEHNPANYTVWQYRRTLIKHLKKDLQEELDYLSDVIRDNPKNYQVWHHRKLIVELTGEAGSELDFSAEMFRDDAKNYHAWQHRHWVVKRFELWSSELEFASRLLHEDLRNNSAWNYRYYLVSNTTGWSESEVVMREIEFTKELIKKAPRNESAWNYLNGILVASDQPSARQSAVVFAEELRLNEAARSSPYLIGFLIDSLEASIDSASTQEQKGAVFSQIDELIAEVTQVDPIRKNYWNFMRQYLRDRHHC